MTKTETFNSDINRYVFDFDICNAKNGWAQMDTTQDAHYYGNWANPKTLTIISYVEGDICKLQADNKQEFIDEIRKIEKWNYENDYGLNIDCMGNEETIKLFSDMRLSDLLWGRSERVGLKSN